MDEKVYPTLSLESKVCPPITASTVQEIALGMPKHVCSYLGEAVRNTAILLPDHMADVLNKHSYTGQKAGSYILTNPIKFLLFLMTSPTFTRFEHPAVRTGTRLFQSPGQVGVLGIRHLNRFDSHLLYAMPSHPDSEDYGLYYDTDRAEEVHLNIDLSVLVTESDGNTVIATAFPGSPAEPGDLSKDALRKSDLREEGGIFWGSATDFQEFFEQTRRTPPPVHLCLIGD